MTTPTVSRAPAGGTTRTTPREPPPQAARSALDAEHGRQADQRVKGPHASELANHPSAPSPVGKTACRAQGSRVAETNATASNHDYFNHSKTPTPQCLLNNAVATLAQEVVNRMGRMGMMEEIQPILLLSFPSPPSC